MTDHLILSALPTPNGELHLGHLGGPFLAADALARHLRAQGHRVTTVSATDGWESYVLDAARREERSPQETARAYHAAVETALIAADCEPDVFLDVRTEPTASDHDDWHHWLTERLTARDRVEIRGERLLADASTGEELIACWLAGRCPGCGEGVAGYTCEACGMWFQPDGVRDPRPRHPRSGIRTTETSSAFLRLDADLLVRMARERRVPDEYVDLIHRYVELNGPVWRLTHPLGWGVPWSTGLRLPPRQVHSTYALGTTAMFLSAGEQYARLHGLSRNPFLSEGHDRPRFALCFGMDGALPLLMQLAVQEAAEVPSAPDAYRFNQFMTLDGEKFSTSRGHVIRVLDWVDAGLDTDALRFHLARLSPGEKPTDFTAERFADDVTQALVGRLGRVLDLCEVDRRQESSSDPASVRARYETIAARHRWAFATGDLAEAAAAVDDWIGAAPDAIGAAGARGVLAVLAALAAPLMPRWANVVWKRLALPGGPALRAAGELLSRPGGFLPVPAHQLRFDPVSPDAVRALMPQTR